eukprot:gene10955-13419_t
MSLSSLGLYTDDDDDEDDNEIINSNQPNINNNDQQQQQPVLNQLQPKTTTTTTISNNNNIESYNSPYNEEYGDSKLSISKVNEKPYGLRVTEEQEFDDVEEKDDDSDEDEEKEEREEIENDISNSNNNKKSSSTVDYIRREEIDENNNNNNKYNKLNIKNKHHNVHIHATMENFTPPLNQIINTPPTPTLSSPPTLETMPTSTNPNFNNICPNVISTPPSKSSSLSSINSSFLPPEPEGEVDSIIKEKILRYHKMKQEGISINENLRSSSAFKNPFILEKLISFCEIKENGSNFAKEIFDPYGYSPDCFYEELSKKQRESDEMRAYEKMYRNKIDFTSPSSTTTTTTTTTTASSISNPFSTTTITNQQPNPQTIAKPPPPKKKLNKWEKQKQKQKLKEQNKLQQQKTQQQQQQQQQQKGSIITAAPTINLDKKKRDEPSTQSHIDSVLKRFRSTTGNI